MERGACREADPELFHPELAPTMRLAIKICKVCPVVNECLSYALAHMRDEDNDPACRAIGQHGVWGGTTPQQRRIIARQRKVA